MKKSFFLSLLLYSLLFGSNGGMNDLFNLSLEELMNIDEKK